MSEVDQLLEWEPIRRIPKNLVDELSLAEEQLFGTILHETCRSYRLSSRRGTLFEPI